MKEYAYVIEVPAIEEEERAYDHDRPISGLILHQLRHLHAAEQSLPAKDRTKININALHTEIEAGKYIRKVTKKLHPQGAKRTSGQASRRKPAASAKKHRTATKGGK